MSKARQIKDEIWSDDWFFTLNSTEKLAWMFLLTNDRCNIAGIYKLNFVWASRVSGIPEEEFKAAIDRFKSEKKLLIKDDWIVIVNFVKHQSKNPSVVKGIRRIVNDLPTEVVEILTETQLNLKDPKYKTIGVTRKERIKKRDDFKCVKCGSEEKLEVDHIVPLFKGGKNIDENLQTLCKKCHQEKSVGEMRETGCHTLLNSTLLNSTQPIGNVEKMFDVSDGETEKKYDEEDMRLTNLLIELIKQNNPDWQMRGKIETWAEHIEKLRRIDQRTPEQIEYMIRWVQGHPFWQSNILSTAKLREKFNDPLIPQLKRDMADRLKQQQHANKPKMI